MAMTTPVCAERIPSALREVAQTLEETGWAAEVLDPEWRLVSVTQELRTLLGAVSPEDLGVGHSVLSARHNATWAEYIPAEASLDCLRQHVPYMLHDMGEGAREALLEQARPQWRAEIATAEPAAAPPAWTTTLGFQHAPGERMVARYLAQRVHGPDGDLLGTTFTYGSPLPASVLALVTRGSGELFRRMARLAKPARQEAAVLFADLQASTPLSKRLPSAQYFALLQDLNTELDQVVIQTGGVVGKHAGDGVSAFFLADDLGSPSGAGRAAIEAARGMTSASARIAGIHAVRDGMISAADIHLNVGVHWGGTLYMGQVVTGGRLEVTALGDEVNECARIQQSARDGDLLASKSLIERLSPGDAGAVGLDPDTTTYTPLGDLPGATEKAARDAGGLAVTRLAGAV
jgi:class 3 adenylate cyclase